VLGSPLIVVLAHTSCGAVKSACDVFTKNATYPGAIGRMIEPILPAALAVRSDPGDLVNNAAKGQGKSLNLSRLAFGQHRFESLIGRSDVRAESV
jgi:carbonic anhydrase